MTSRQAEDQFSDLTAVILAGGLGTRLRPVVKDRPKVLAQVSGRPFLTHLLDQLADAGLRHVVLCTGYLGDQVEAMFGDSYRMLKLCYSREPALLGTAGALRLALPLFRSDPILVMNGDSFCQVDLKAFWKWHLTRQAKASLALVKVSNASPYGLVEVSSGGDILSFNEKIDKEGPAWVNAGIYILSRFSILAIPVNGTTSLELQMFPTWIGQSFYGYQSDGRLVDIGDPSGYLMATKFFEGARHQ